MSRHRLRPGGHHRMQVKSRGFCPGLVSRRRATGAVLTVQVGAPVVLGVAALFSSQAPIPLVGMDLTSPPSLFAPAPSTVLPGLTAPSGPGASLHGTFGFPQVLASGVGGQVVDVPNLLRVASISDTSVVRLGVSSTTPTYVGRHRFVGPPCHPPVLKPPPPVSSPPVDQPAPDPDPTPGPTPIPDPPPGDAAQTPPSPELPPVNVPVDLPPVDLPPAPDVVSDPVGSVTDTVKDTTAPVTDTVKDTAGDVVGAVKDTVDSVVDAPKDDSSSKDTSDSAKSDSGSSDTKSDTSSKSDDSSSKSDSSDSKPDTSGSDSSSSDTHSSGDSSHDSN